MKITITIFILFITLNFSNLSNLSFAQGTHNDTSGLIIQYPAGWEERYFNPEVFTLSNENGVMVFSKKVNDDPYSSGDIYNEIDGNYEYYLESLKDAAGDLIEITDYGKTFIDEKESIYFEIILKEDELEGDEIRKAKAILVKTTQYLYYILILPNKDKYDRFLTDSEAITSNISIQM
jgi:hypothetical protein